MKQNIKNYYNDVVRKPAYWLPILLFAIAAFGFSLFNRSISTDDLWTVLPQIDNTIQGGRWGMSVWSHLLGAYTYSPYLDEFIALVNLILSAVGIGFLFYRYGKLTDVLGYTIFSSILVTFPLIVEIWNYNKANFYFTGGLLLGTLALIILTSDYKLWVKYIIACVLLILPAASYEASVFTYLTLFCIIVFYKFVVVAEERPTFRIISGMLVSAIIPLVMAAMVKFAVPFIHNAIFHTPYTSFGATEIGWFEGGLGTTISTLIHANIYLYVIAAMIYLPIAEFLFCACLFGGYAIWRSVKLKNTFPVLWAIVVIISIFSLAILQGSGMPYRTAQGVSVFVAFVLFVLYQKISVTRLTIFKRIAIVLLFALCWHQSAFIHRIQSLNNLRADCEAAVIHDIGRRLMSDYDKKPVVVVSAYTPGAWVREQVCVDKNSWNGRLFISVCSALGLSSDDGGDTKIVGNNVNAYLSSHEVLTPKMIFKYFGYDVEIVTSSEVIKQAVMIAKENNMRPYQILDYGPYLIVQISAKEYFEEE